MEGVQSVTELLLVGVLVVEKACFYLVVVSGDKSVLVSVASENACSKFALSVWVEKDWTNKG